VSLVNNDPCAVSAREIDDSLERSEVAVHREHRIGHDQRRPASGAPEAGCERVEVAVFINDGLGPGLATAVDDRGVVEGVGQNHITATSKRRDHACIGEEARAEHHAGLVALELSELLFKPAVQCVIARYQPRSSDARSPPVGCPRR